MKKSYFWFVLLCFLIVLANVIGLNIFLRIAIATNALIIIVNVIIKIRRMLNVRASEEEKNKDLDSRQI